MLIQSISLTGFGVLGDFRAEFAAPGTNVILGPNESGKSTLCKSISSILYGIQGSANLQTWGSASSNGTIEITTNNGKLTIQRDFQNNYVRVYHQALASEEQQLLLDGVVAPRGRTDIASHYREILKDNGVPTESVLARTGYVPQLRVETNLDDDVRRQLSGAGQADYRVAQQKLQETYEDLTCENLSGGQSRRKAREIERLDNRISEAERELTTACDIYRERSRVTQTIEKHSRSVIELKARKEQQERDIYELNKYLNALKEYHHQSDVRQVLKREQDQLKNTSENLTRAQQDYDAPSLIFWRNLDEDGRQKLRRYLDSDPDSLFEKESQLKRRIGSLEAEIENLGLEKFFSAPDNLVTLIDDYQRRSTEIGNTFTELLSLENLTPEQKPEKQQKWIWGVPVGGLLLGFLVGIAISPSNPIVGGIVSALVMGIVSLAIVLFILSTEKRRHLSGGAKNDQKIAELKGRLEYAKGLLAEIEVSLTGWIDLPIDEDNFHMLRHQWEQFVPLRRDLEETNSKLHTLVQQPTFSLRNDLKLTEILNAFPTEVLAQRIKQAEDIERKIQVLQDQYANLSADRSQQGDLDDVTRKMDEARELLDSLERSRPTLSQYRGELSNGELALDSLNQQHLDTERSLNLAESIMHNADRELATIDAQNTRDPILIQEELEDLRETLSRLTLRKNALRLAIISLQDVVEEYQADNIDRLARRAGDYIIDFTDRRYTDVQLVGDGEIRVVTKDNRILSPEQLSQGTKDQLFLALRLAILDLLAADLSVPLVLDDTFVNFDSQRLEAVHESLRSIGDSRQVLLLSHSDIYQDWGDSVIWLRAPNSANEN